MMQHSDELVIELLPAQREFLHCDLDTTLDVAIYQGGFGSGKTWSGSLLGLLLSQKYHGILGLVLAKTYPMVRDTTMRTYFEHLDAFKLRKKDYTFNKSESSLVFHCWGDSTILFRHLQDPEKIKSINAGWIELEEASQLSEADFQMVLSRVRQVGFPRRRVFGHTNPSATKGWIFKYFVQNNQGKQVIETEDCEGQAIVHYRRILAPTTENTFLSPEYVANMRQQYDEHYYRINVLGQDGDYTAGLVCKMWSELNIRETEYIPEQKIYITCDFNVDPMCWLLAHRYNGEFHYFDEIVLENTTTTETVDEFHRRHASHTNGIIVTGDASGNNRSTQAGAAGQTNYTQIRNRLSELGFRDIKVDIRQANPAIADRVAAWNGAICNADGIRRVFVHPRCVRLIQNLENLSYIEGTSQIDLPTANEISKDRNLKFMGHPFDAASYLVEKYAPVVARSNKEIPGFYVPDIPFSI
jgi:PBSX family phage terminase large subunit